MPYTPILATLGYILSPDGGRVLLVHRNKRHNDAHYGKYNGLGGKLEADEDIVACLRREVREESGLECEQLQLRGTISWPGFGKQGEDWFGFIFLVERFSGEPWRENADGAAGMDRDPSASSNCLPLWEGDPSIFLPARIISDRHALSRRFHGVMPVTCRDGRPVSWTYNLL